MNKSISLKIHHHISYSWVRNSNVNLAVSKSFNFDCNVLEFLDEIIKNLVFNCFLIRF